MYANEYNGLAVVRVDERLPYVRSFGTPRAVNGPILPPPGKPPRKESRVLTLRLPATSVEALAAIAKASHLTLNAVGVAFLDFALAEYRKEQAWKAAQDAK